MTQREALEILKLGHNVFLTGPAGSGKTHVLNDYVKLLRGNGVEVAVTASTGIAAAHLGGMTIHSWSGVGIKRELNSADLEQIFKKAPLRKRLKKTRVLIIDEISMLDGERFDLVDQICRHLRDNRNPFGGMQVVVCGDFFQLPPVADPGTSASFAFSSAAWKNSNLKICYLSEQHRQSDRRFLNLLSEIRSGAVSEKSRDLLRGRYLKSIADFAKPTRLYTHNHNVDRINLEELEQIHGYARTYEMSSKGKEKFVEILRKGCLAPESLTLKPGALVMFVKNNFERGYVNGTLGKVIGFEKESGHPIVETRSGKKIVADPVTWVFEDDGKIKAEVSQVPLRLAWAITVHKSQGMSLDCAEIDLSRAFERGMGYVALSRVRTLAGIRLLGLNEIALEVSPEIAEFDAELRKQSH